ncbi:MAG: flippase-like domain-containing protein [Aquihabitans sp.]
MTITALPTPTLDSTPAPGDDRDFGDTGCTITRSPRALGQLLVYVAAIAAIAVGVRLLDRTAIGLRVDVRQAAHHVPSALGSVFDALAITIAVIVWVLGVVDAAVHRSARQVLGLLVGPLLAASTILIIGASLDGPLAPGTGGALWVDAVVAAGAAALTITRLVSVARYQRWVSAAFVAATLIGGGWVVESVAGRLLVLAVGGAAGALAALAIGTPARRATPRAVVAGLERQGFLIEHIEPQGGDARGSVPWLARTSGGTELFVKTYGDDERIADLLFRTWRKLRLRSSGDHVPAASLLHAVEHEAFASTRAAATGARVPRVLAVGSLDNGGVFAVHEAVPGRTLDAIVDEDGPEGLTDATLRQVWSMVHRLHRSGIAHRDLRGANIVIDRAGEVWLVDFAFSDVVASREVQDRDLVELLASTAILVGDDRAIAAAVDTLGRVQMEAALPLVQPLAVSAATRKRLGRSGFTHLRTTLADRLDSPEPRLPRLGRVDVRSILSLAALTAAVWALLPQIGQSGDLWDQLPEANRTLLALAALASMFTYVGATLSLKGAVANDLPTIGAFRVQLASSFTNRVTPAKVGGVALNARWLVRQGETSPTAVAAISVNSLAGLFVHVVMTVFVVIWAGKVGLGDLNLPSARSIGLGLLLIAATVALTFAIPPLRSLVNYRIRPRVKQSTEAIRETARQPSRLVMLFGGSAIVSLCYIAALALSLAAVGASVPLSTVALVYLAGSALASAAPTPGGLGATEAVFAAALITTGVPRSEAIPAVLLYRFATFWLPILPGWISFMMMQRADEL